ncbi:Ig-like domain-containing protein [Rubellicoccus peritrichatus]|uniref:Ig-like domain-containing protein n=1 Tax=Rubellicoccus peritrichatus TaxID=3080537 RepID=A0AAQ3LC52_9BACT|nr:Ig-like domain-containing protein [Puniceicoccus sp. CR14]WOO43394.1 Ig-like domain-containing protein [Puniceicoccus sp. CR14]
MNLFNRRRIASSLIHRSGHKAASGQRLRWPKRLIGKQNGQQGRWPLPNTRILQGMAPPIQNGKLQMIIEKWKTSLRALCAFSVLSVSSFVTPAHADLYPQWWIDQGVIMDGQQSPAAPGETGHDPAAWDAWVAGNFTPANAGQAKNLAQKAMFEMEAKQAGSAGTTITSLVNGFSSTAETGFVPINAGQVKNLAKTFYDRFHEVDFTVTLSDGTIIADNTYPWDPATPVEQNFTPVNVGQLKNVFSFDLATWPPTSLLVPPSAPPTYDRAYARLIKPAVGSYAVVGQAVAVESVAGFPSDTLSQIEFFVDSGSLGAADTTSPYEAIWTPSSAGTYALSATATSGSSATVSSPEVIVTIEADADADLLGDTWESQHGITSPTDDSDGDGLLATDEFANGNSPNSKDHPVVELSLFSVSI